MKSILNELGVVPYINAHDTIHFMAPAAWKKAQLKP